MISVKRVSVALALTWGLIFGAFAMPSSASAQALGGLDPRFYGNWCAQGVPNHRASIVQTGGGVRLTNEVGLTSSGHASSSGDTIVAPQWTVTGTLSPDGHRISWTNGTFWQRCHGGGSSSATLGGTWYGNGYASRICQASQQYGSLSFRNEIGITAQGSFTGKRTFTATWLGTPVTGTLRKDGTRIDWSNGTYWTRTPQH